MPALLMPLTQKWPVQCREHKRCQRAGVGGLGSVCGGGIRLFMYVSFCLFVCFFEIVNPHYGHFVNGCCELTSDIFVPFSSIFEPFI